MCTALLLFVTGVCCKNNNENMSKKNNNDKTEKILFINGNPQVNVNTAALAKPLLEGFNYKTLMLTERQWCQCREGLHALPKIMFDLFFKIGGGVSNRWCVFLTAVGTFLREGMKPSPAQGMRHPDLHFLASN